MPEQLRINQNQQPWAYLSFVNPTVPRKVFHEFELAELLERDEDDLRKTLP